MARTKVRIDTKNDDIPALKGEVGRCKTTLKNRFVKLAGKSFGIYQSKEIDKFITKAYEIVKFSLFGDFAPNAEQMPLCVIATGSYALNEMTVKSKIDLALIYKNVSGYTSELIAARLQEAFDIVGLETNCKSYELDAFAKQLLGDIESKTLFYQVRFVCGSKKLYKLAKEQIGVVKSHNKEEFISYHLGKLGEYEMMRTMNLRPNLRDGYGGFYDYKRIFWLINMIDENTPRTHAFKFIDEKENSEINLAVDYISSLRSALQLCGGESELGAEFLPQMTKIMQTKEKKQLGAKTLLLCKTLNCMHTIALYSRFLAAVIFGGQSYAPIDAKEALVRLVTLDKPLSISEIFALKRCEIAKFEFDEIFAIFKQIFYSQNAAFGLKALLEAGILFDFIKPLEVLKFFPQDFCDICLDELGVEIVRCLDEKSSSKEGEFVGRIWREFSPNEQALVRLCALFVPLGQVEFGGSAANIFRSYANKFELDSNELGLGVLLVKHNALMSEMVGEDFYEQSELLNFISYFNTAKIDEQKALKMLLVLSFATLLAKNQLTHYSAKSLVELYTLSLNALLHTKDALLDEATKRVKKELLLRKNRDFNALDAQTQKQILQVKSNLIFAKYDASEIVEICEFAASKNVAVRVCETPNLALQLVVKKGWNIVAVLGALSEFDLNYMEICELFEGKFFVFLDFAKQIDKKAKSSVESLVLQAFCNPKTPSAFTPKIAAYEVSLDLNHSKNYAQVKLNTADQRGLMAYVLDIFARYDINVVSGRIQTIRGRTRNLFLLENSEILQKNYAKILSDLTTA